MLPEVKTGDWILPMGNSTISKLIKKATFGKVNHAALAYDKDTVFETDGAWFKAKFNPIQKYQERPVYLIRPLFISDYGLLQRLCHKYDGLPYSYWDIATNGMFFWLHPELRKKVVRLLGRKQFAICSELTSRITFEATGYKQLRDFEGLTPEDLLQIALNYPDMFTVQYCDNSVSSSSSH